jgi:prepilin-type N-terminal cleavage/methylation domain-containing protein
MSLMNIKNMKNEKGFTIVELLIVIVVIGILAAITIVAYNGIQNRANKSAAQAAGNVVIKKAEAANSIASSYPVAIGDFAANKESDLAGSGLTIGTPSATNGKNTVRYTPCTATGGKVGYWDYTNATPQIVDITVGTPGTCGTALAGGPY